MDRGKIACNTLLVILPTFLSGVAFLLLVFRNRIVSMEDPGWIFTDIQVGYVLAIGTFASTVAPLLLRIVFLRKPTEA